MEKDTKKWRWVSKRYKNPQDLQKKVDEYFKSGLKKKTIITKSGLPVTVEIPTITWLCLFLWFEDRHSFNSYEKYPEFTSTIKQARSRIESHYEELAQEGNTGAIFALKNFGWKDKTEVETTEKKIEVTADLSQKSAKELKDVFASLIS